MERHGLNTPLFRYSSLRSRYLTATTFITLIVLAGALFAQAYVRDIGHSRAENMVARNTAAHQGHLLRNAVRHAEQALEWFMWSPSEERREEVRIALDTAVARQKELAQSAWYASSELHGEGVSLGTALPALKGLFDGLMRQRMVEIRQQANTRTDAGTGADLAMLDKRVEPLLTKIWGKLDRLDQVLERTTAQDVTLLAQLAEKVTRVLWVLTLGGFALTLAGFIMMERGILTPVATMARALKAEARGDEPVEIPAANAEETQDLIDAFALMRRQVEDRQNALEHQALHDHLTGLPNRVLMGDRLEQAVNLARRDTESVALLLLDLDGFKEVNDTLGHHAGDELLKQLGHHLPSLLRHSDTVARLGGDEFGVVLPDAGEEEAIQAARKLLSGLRQPFVVGGQGLYIGCSIGIAVYPQHAGDPMELNRCADIAMYTAKREKRGVCLYEPGNDQESSRRLSLANDLYAAIAEGRLQLCYQPQIDLESGKYSGLEVLLRWEHPERGNIRPDEFVSIAERSGLIRQLTQWVLDQSLAQYAAWRDRGIFVGNLAINLSVYNLQDSDLADNVALALENWQVPPEAITLEITESAMMVDPTHALKMLEELNTIGVQLAIDDFGTGYSSLGYLKRLPVRKLKIDKSFVMDMLSDENDAVIVRSTVDLAHNLGLKVVAEGVENAEVLQLLNSLRCDTAQGYFVSHPLPVDQFEAWLKRKEEEAASAGQGLAGEGEARLAAVR